LGAAGTATDAGIAVKFTQRDGRTGACSSTGTWSGSPYTVQLLENTKASQPWRRAASSTAAVPAMLFRQYFSGLVTLSPTALKAAKCTMPAKGPACVKTRSSSSGEVQSPSHRAMGRPRMVSMPATAFLLEKMELPATAKETRKTLAEVDKTRQLLFLVQDGVTTHVLNTSTGDDREYTEPDSNTPGVMITDTSVTPVGTFRINRERPDGWWIGDLGQIYRPKYFIGGVAIHGSLSVPAYPASHGCVRVSVAAMDMIWEQDILPRGTTVVVYGEIS
jgi:lipoprotein-anchoring transpeptidase ErfK/SrfK